MTIYLVQNDDKPLDVTLEDAGDLDGASVEFHMRQRRGDKEVTATCSVISVPAKQVRTPWAAGDLDTAGVFEAEWEIDYGDGEETAPNSKKEIIQIREEIA